MQVQFQQTQTRFQGGFSPAVQYPWQAKLGNPVIWHHWSDFQESKADKNVPIYVHLNAPLDESLKTKLADAGMHILTGSGKVLVNGDVAASNLPKLAEVDEVKLIRGAVELAVKATSEPKFGACSASYSSEE